jgi:hypothetical protein
METDPNLIWLSKNWNYNVTGTYFLFSHGVLLDSSNASLAKKPPLFFL